MKRAFALTVATMVAVAGMAVAAGVGVAGVGVRYSGQTSQPLPITLVLNASGLISGKYLANYYCVRPNGLSIRAVRQPTTLGPSSFGRARHIDYRQTVGGGTNEDQTQIVATVVCHER